MHRNSQSLVSNLVPTFVALALLLALPASAQVTLPGANHGTDGPLDATAANIVLDLDLAVEGVWDQAGTGTGVYDLAKHAVVYKFSSLVIPSGRSVSFTHTNRNAPVVFLVQGSATIAGLLFVGGQNGVATVGVYARPGPGGYRGGSPGSPGMGPRGGSSSSSPWGEHADGPTAYGNNLLIPLTGGSGGYGFSFGGGAGGGGLLLVCEGTLTISGSVNANGGITWNGSQNVSSGAGGSVRLVADQILGSGTVFARGAFGGLNGRIRMEVVSAPPSSTLVSNSLPAPLQAIAADPLPIWPAATQSSVRLDSIGGIAIPADPDASLTVGSTDAFLATTGTTQFQVTTSNLNPAQTVVTVRIAVQTGAGGTGSTISVNATHTSGDTTQSTWTASATLPTTRPASVTVHARPL